MQPTARQHIFINYCGDDARGVSGRVVDWLRVGFGGERVLHDSTSLDEDTWRDRIDAALAKSAVFVALIGPRWADADNLARLHDPHDRARHELLGALACADITLLPTLVEGAPVPELADLPAALQALFSGRSTRLLRESCWNDDIRALSDEIAAATGLAVAPDIDIMIRARQRVAERERALQLQPEQIGAQRRSIDELAGKLALAPAGERRALAAAFAELAQGNPLPAEASFERDCEAQAGRGADARHGIAQAARNVANFALLRDSAKAADFYRKALAAEPDHGETTRLLGQVLIALGDLDGAQAMFDHSPETARVIGNTWGRMAAQTGLGDVYRASGRAAAAIMAYKAALHLAEQRLAHDPAGPQRQTDVALSCARLGRLDRGQSVEARRGHLLRGRDILLTLKAAGRLLPNQDWIAWFDDELARLPQVASLQAP